MHKLPGGKPTGKRKASTKSLWWGCIWPAQRTAQRPFIVPEAQSLGAGERGGQTCFRARCIQAFCATPYPVVKRTKVTDDNL